MEKSQRVYIPAAGRDWLLPLYDPLVKLMGADRARQALVDQAGIRPTDNVLDVGCGTGTLVTSIKRFYPTAHVVGFDPDTKALAQARRKAARAGVSVQFDQGFSDELPYADSFFDRAFSSFMLHHLEAGEKEKTLREIRRVLKPGGSIHLLDFGGPDAGPSGFLAHAFHAHQRLQDNFGGCILGLMSKAGFVDPRETGHHSTLFGQVAYYTAIVPDR